jgi:hypothetical protein
MDIINKPYRYDKAIIEENFVYFFQTIFEIVYEIRFKTTFYIFPEETPYYNQSY